MNAKKLIRETLRMKLLAGGEPGKYVLNVSPRGVKVAACGDYNLAMLAGMDDFWEHIPFHRGTPELTSIFELEGNASHSERRFSCVFDGHSKTYTSERVNVIPDGYTCTMTTAKEIRDVIDNSERKAKRGDDSGSPFGDYFIFHDKGHYIISHQVADALLNELFATEHSYVFMQVVRKLVEEAREKDK